MADDHPAGEGGEHEDVEGDKAGDRDLEVHVDLLLGSRHFRGRLGCGDLVGVVPAFAWPASHLAGMGQRRLGEDLVVPVDA